MTLSIARCILRIRLRRKLYLDDVFVILGIACLAISTAALYSLTDLLFHLETAYMGTTVTAKVTEDDTLSFIKATKWTYLYIDFTWTAIFAIKFSFLVFFKNLLVGVSRKLTIYYWCLFGFTSVSWVFGCIAPFIWCSHLAVLRVASKLRCQ